MIKELKLVGYERKEKEYNDKVYVNYKLNLSYPSNDKGDMSIVINTSDYFLKKSFKVVNGVSQVGLKIEDIFNTKCNYILTYNETYKRYEIEQCYYVK